jgi:phage regulator Rha-like protein
MSLAIIHQKIFEVRRQRVMLDFDLAELYEVETKRINEQVKRNQDRFPQDFMFRLTEKEWFSMRSQIVTASANERIPSQNATASQKKRNTTATPYAFTEHGVTMLASVLRSKKAIDMNIAIVRAFTAMRHFANSHKDIFEQINDLRNEMQIRLGEHDTQLAAIYDALENLLDKKQDEIEAAENWQKRPRIGFKKTD